MHTRRLMFQTPVELQILRLNNVIINTYTVSTFEF